MRNRFEVYFSSLYGCELWDLDNRSLSDLCVAWRLQRLGVTKSMEITSEFSSITDYIANH